MLTRLPVCAGIFSCASLLFREFRNRPRAVRAVRCIRDDSARRMELKGISIVRQGKIQFILGMIERLTRLLKNSFVNYYYRWESMKALLEECK